MVWCRNGGGTADSYLGYAQVIFTAACCPSGRSTVWDYVDGRLKPVRTVVERKPH